MTEKQYKYEIRKTGKFGDLVDKIVCLMSENDSYLGRFHITVLKYGKELLEVSASDYGYTILQLAFWRPDYAIKQKTL